MLDLHKSTIALAASIAAGCRSCADYHLGALERAGGGVADKEKAITAASCGIDAARVGLLAHARREDPAKPCCDGGDTVLDALLGLAVAMAVADSAAVRRWRTYADAAGASESDLAVVLGLARQVRERAAHYAEQAFGDAGQPAAGPCAGSTPCGCG